MRTHINELPFLVNIGITLLIVPVGLRAENSIMSLKTVLCIIELQVNANWS